MKKFMMWVINLTGSNKSSSFKYMIKKEVTTINRMIFYNKKVIITTCTKKNACRKKKYMNLNP
jgi:hypothetical protein